MFLTKKYKAQTAQKMILCVLIYEKNDSRNRFFSTENEDFLIGDIAFREISQHNIGCPERFILTFCIKICYNC